VSGESEYTDQEAKEDGLHCDERLVERIKDDIKCRDLQDKTVVWTRLVDGSRKDKDEIY
jgi:hypothetical protein